MILKEKINGTGEKRKGEGESEKRKIPKGKKTERKHYMRKDPLLPQLENKKNSREKKITKGKERRKK
jgi:hypothetical protein